MSVPDLLALARTGPVHFMGVGGAGMCALAELLLREGGAVTGCDLKPSDATRRLEVLGARVAAVHDPAHLEGASALVVTAAVPDDHPELVAARRQGVPVVKRAAALGALVNRGRVVAVAGTHGKTSTTALAVHVLAAAGLDPTGFVGGTVPSWQGNLRYGASDLSVVEADEYDRSFHALEADVAVVTNLEADHLDVYGDLAGVREAFRVFLTRLRPGGRAIVCGDDPGAASLLAAVAGAGYTYGLSAGSQLRAVDLRTGADGTRFRVVEDGRDRGPARVPRPGVHALRNALAAGAVARRFGAHWRDICSGWASFGGVGRRFQRLGEVAGVAVIDDYAHHPTEIRATLGAAREAFPDRRLVAVFQPHLYSRTRDFADEFGKALASADRVWVTDVFPAREAPLPGVDGELVARAVEAAGGRVTYHAALDGLATAVAGAAAAGDLVLTLGAGSVERVGSEVLRELGVVHA
jgi:UDP-N-acetylmuramate--alanine ligase